MSQNLLAVFSDNWNKTFPILPRIRRTFIGLLIFCALFISIGISEKEGITLPVKSLNATLLSKQTIAEYPNARVVTGSLLNIPDPGIAERILLPGVTTDLDIITLFFLAIASIVIILIAPKLQQHQVFRKDISRQISLLGYLLALHGLIGVYRLLMYAPQHIQAITHNEFTSMHAGFPIMIYTEFYFSMVVIALAGVYRRGVQLQKENDLTV